jgi:hypothetical protein
MVFYDNEAKVFDYSRMELLPSDINLAVVVSEWFKEKKDYLVTCTKHNCKFHKKHCPINNELVELGLLTDCDETLCSLALDIKTRLSISEGF